MLGWHFLAKDGRLRYPLVAGGERPVVTRGATYRVPGPVSLCEHGLHASRRALDALFYAPGPIVCRVRLSGEILEGDDKAVASERTVLWLADATRVLHEFACDVAASALSREREAGREPDPRSWAAIAAKRAWILGEIDDARLCAAWSAAWDAARSAARDAAMDAARAAARAAARDAAWDAAWGAAWAAAWAAARSAARGAAWAAAWRSLNEDLEMRLRALGPGGEEVS